MTTKPNKNSAGVTLPELLVTIVVAGLVISLIFASYQTLYKGFGMQGKRVEALQQAVVTKKAVDKALEGVAVVTNCTGNSLEYVKVHSMDKGTALFKDSVLYLQSKPTITMVNRFEFSLVSANEQKKDSLQAVVLQWEATTRAGVWIGGARRILFKAK